MYQYHQYQGSGVQVGGYRNAHDATVQPGAVINGWATGPPKPLPSTAAAGQEQVVER